MTNTVVAALVQEIGETTPANVAQGNLSIGLVFNDRNHDMRLVGRLAPLRNNDYPEDKFERDALDDAMVGVARTSVERVNGDWMYRRSIPLSNFAPQCQMCHGNFAALPSTAWVGALMLRIPIDEGSCYDSGMLPRWASLSVALIVATLVACGGAKPVCKLPAGLEAAGKAAPPFLWRATRDDGVTVWLYGTIHNGGRGDVAQAAWRALEGVPNFASELGDTEPDPEKTRELAIQAHGRGIDQLLPANDWYDLRDELRGAVKEDVLRRARPWYAMTQLMKKVSPGPSPTMDFALAAHARDKKKAVDSLERWDEQLAALDKAVKVSDLQQAIHARNTMACELTTLLATYRTGDLDAMQKRLIVDGTSSLLVPRNKLWLPRIAAYFDRGGGFVAVGLGHMIGDEGLPALLGKTGYKVERATP